jgi:chemotaxis protein MotB
MSDGNIVIKKVKKGGEHGHHGGAWKVAYADFVTAMMAFFLLMWLINTTSPEQKRGIADYFAPASVSESTSGSGSILAGTALGEDGAKQKGSSTAIEQQTPPSTPAEAADASDAAAAGGGQPSDDAMQKAMSLRDQAAFQAAEVSIRQAMQDMPELSELSKQLLVDQTPEGLRIQIVDQEGRPMFDPASITPNPRAKALLRVVSKIIARLPNRITVSGHTDAGSPPRGSDNWQLSAARANAARIILESAGVPSDRIYQVAGKAGAEPLYPDDPTQPGNRRISIVLLREAPVLPPDQDF